MQKEVTKWEELGWGGRTGVGALQGVSPGLGASPPLPELAHCGRNTEGVVADGVEDGVEGPVQATQHPQQQQHRQGLQELPYLPSEQEGQSWAAPPALAQSPLCHLCPPPLRPLPLVGSGGLPSHQPHHIFHF